MCKHCLLNRLFCQQHLAKFWLSVGPIFTVLPISPSFLVHFRPVKYQIEALYVLYAMVRGWPAKSCFWSGQHLGQTSVKLSQTWSNLPKLREMCAGPRLEVLLMWRTPFGSTRLGRSCLVLCADTWENPRGKNRVMIVAPSLFNVSWHKECWIKNKWLDLFPLRFSRFSCPFTVAVQFASVYVSIFLALKQAFQGSKKIGQGTKRRCTARGGISAEKAGSCGFTTRGALWGRARSHFIRTDRLFSIHFVFFSSLSLFEKHSAPASSFAHFSRSRTPIDNPFVPTRHTSKHLPILPILFNFERLECAVLVVLSLCLSAFFLCIFAFVSFDFTCHCMFWDGLHT